MTTESIARQKALWAVLSIAMLLTLMANSTESRAGSQRSYIGKAAVFEFDLKSTDPIDDYTETVKDITTKVILSEMERSPMFRSVSFVPRSDCLTRRERNYCLRERIDFYLTGELNFIRGNASIKTQWFNLKQNTQGEEQAFIGIDDLQDFKKIMKEVMLLSRRIEEKTIRAPSTHDNLSQEILVSCFTSGRFLHGKSSQMKSVREFDFIGQYTTLELPFFLNQKLNRLGINSEKIRIRGMAMEEYYKRCIHGNSLGSQKELRYVITGTIIGKEDVVIVKPILLDQKESGSIPMNFNFSIPAYKIEKLPQIIADKLAPNLLIALIQGFLAEQGFYPGLPDGVLGSRTEEALAKYQRHNGLNPTGELDNRTLSFMGLTQVH